MKNNKCNTTTSLDDILDRKADINYSCLQVFLSREKMTDYFLPKDFLYVDQFSFRKVSLTDINYCDNNIYLDVYDYIICESKTLCLDIKEKPDFTMVLWQDIADLVREDSNDRTSGSDGLLEFDY